MVMAGYALCPCGTWVVDAVASRTGGLCADCFRPTLAARTSRLEVVGAGFKVAVPRGQAKKKRRRRETEQRTARRRLARESREAARLRVCAMFPDLYDAVLADERMKRGIEPWPVEIAIRGGNPEADIAVMEAMIAQLRGAAK